MKLLNKTSIYFSAILFVMLGLWSVVFYFNLLTEIKESVDEGLENYKRKIIYSFEQDTAKLEPTHFQEGFYRIQKISKNEATAHTDVYLDTMMYMQDADDEIPELEPVRILKTAFKSNTDYYALQIINSMVEEDDLVKELLLDVIALYVLLIVVVILVNRFVLNKLWQPFYNLLQQLSKYKVGSNQSKPNVETSTEEFKDLQNAVGQLLELNESSFAKQKEFIGNAAHELQTPLAIAHNKLELLVESESLKINDAASVAEIMEILQRMVRLNKSLLLLTKIENNQFLDNKTVSFNEITRLIVDDLNEFAEFQSIELKLEENGLFEHNIDPSLAQIIVSNLLRNAIFHNIAHGTVHVRIQNDRFVVQNTGSSTPLNQTQLFSRFFKSKEQTNGSGLGLAIVKAICDLYQLEISYHFDHSLHQFEIKVK